jgi:hypothetical protein
MRVQDRTFLEGPYQDPIYRARRERLFLVAVHVAELRRHAFVTRIARGRGRPWVSTWQ